MGLAHPRRHLYALSRLVLPITRINCLEGSYNDHYTTNAVLLKVLKIEKVINLTFDIGLIIINRDAPRGGGRGGGAAAPLDF